MISGDSGEYEFLTEAVQMSKDVEGLVLELGVRAGMGTKFLIDACVECRPGATVISLDPYGSILYRPREHMEECRLDYDNAMGKQCMVDLAEYVLDKPVHWMPLKMKDMEFFRAFDIGVELYEIDAVRVNKYATVHLDGPHSVEHVLYEVQWFDERMDKGATIVLDDVTPDFIRIEPVNEYFEFLGWDLVKKGIKKNIYVKH
jgi:hypothetical protein